MIGGKDIVIPYWNTGVLVRVIERSFGETFTVKRHVNAILDKMSVNDRAQAAVETIRRGLVRMPG